MDLTKSRQILKIGIKRSTALLVLEPLIKPLEQSPRKNVSNRATDEIDELEVQLEKKLKLEPSLQGDSYASLEQNEDNILKTARFHGIRLPTFSDIMAFQDEQNIPMDIQQLSEQELNENEDSIQFQSMTFNPQVASDSPKFYKAKIKKGDPKNSKSPFKDPEFLPLKIKQKAIKKRILLKKQNKK